jgi:AraC family transcriptional regulator
MTESFNLFLARLSSRASLRAESGRGFAIESYRGSPGDGPEVPSDKHILTMCSKHPSRFEIGRGVDDRVSYVKRPGSLSLVPAGVCPVIRAETNFNLVVCALDSGSVSALDSELEHRPEGEFRLQTNLQDPATRQLMALLTADAKEGCKTERLYTECLTQALAVRIFFLGRKIKHQTRNSDASGLPRHVLRRIVERMRCLSCDLSLQALANESGYSRSHFIQMFRAATGYSPHNYLLNLRLERARDLLRNPSISLIDIALECGFSSHSHMSRLFRRTIGITPSDYRRGLRR